MIKAIDTHYNKRIYTTYKGYRLRGDVPTISKKQLTKQTDYTGMVFSRLTAIECLGIYPKSGWRVWGCICICGNKVAIRSRELREGNTLSCGCLNRELSAARGGRNKKEFGKSAFNQLFYNYQRSAMKRGYEFNLSVDEFKNLIESPCSYCGSLRETKAARAKGTFGDYFYTGIDRVINSIGYCITNTKPCCKQCNIAKGILGEQDFYNWIKKAYENIWKR